VAVAAPLSLVAALYLLGTGRWGSYLGVPGVPLYIGDVLVAGSLVQTAVACRAAGTSWLDVRGAVSRAPVALLLTLAFLAYAVLRAVIGLGDLLSSPMLWLRDLAPYAYAVLALIAFLLPAADGRGQRRAVYGVLVAHLVWVLVVPHVPGLPTTLTIGSATVFEPRPDLDSAVFAIAAGLALSDLLHGGANRSRTATVGLAGFAGLNLYALTTLLTRAGLLAGLLALVAVGLSWALRGRSARDLRGRRGVAILVVLLCLGAVALASPPGQRLVGAFGGGDAASAGTLNARRVTWGGVTDYVLSDPWRTAAGVGFGRDFLADSGTAAALEGDDYVNVRSPHNYLVGTLARLGVAGALLGAAVLGAAAFLGLRRLQRPRGAVSTVAALVVLCLPVTALLGVILESPFGAIPYFWAVGHLARARLDETCAPPDPAVSPAGPRTSDTSR
jgi:hypothetical protein